MTAIRIEVSGISLEAELNQSETARRISELLPLNGAASVWGDEIYFEIPLQLEQAPVLAGRQRLLYIFRADPGQHGRPSQGIQSRKRFRAHHRRRPPLQRGSKRRRGDGDPYLVRQAKTGSGPGMEKRLCSVRV